jgi:hypothetical protein
MEVIQGCRRASSALVGEKMYGDDGMAKLWTPRQALGGSEKMGGDNSQAKL